MSITCLIHDRKGCYPALRGLAVIDPRINDFCFLDEVYSQGPCPDIFVVFFHPRPSSFRKGAPPYNETSLFSRDGTSNQFKQPVPPLCRFSLVLFPLDWFTRILLTPNWNRRRHYTLLHFCHNNHRASVRLRNTIYSSALLLSLSPWFRFSLALCANEK